MVIVNQYHSHFVPALINFGHLYAKITSTLHHSVRLESRMATISQDMETFTKSLSSLSFNTSATPNHASMYKQKQTKSSLDERRATFLEDQKRKRFDYMNLIRDLTETDWYDDPDSMDYELHQPAQKHKNLHKDQLMMSEWMTEVPVNFDTDWLCVPCPMGKRCLVIASRGKTSSWTKAALHIATFRSCLPGGNSQNSRDNTILDCIYNKALDIYYILDLMSWRAQPLYDSETEFRFYWLHTKLQENPEILTASKPNTPKFVALTSHPCSRDQIHDALDTPGFSVEMDGVLFYHRHTHYTLGSTPLVGWLKPFMLPEVMDVDVPRRVRGTRPSNYVDYKTYIERFNEKHVKRQPGGMFKRSQALTGTAGGEPITHEPFTPRDTQTRGQKKGAKRREHDKENRDDDSSGTRTLSVRAADTRGAVGGIEERVEESGMGRIEEDGVDLRATNVGVVDEGGGGDDEGIVEMESEAGVGGPPR